MPLEQLPLDLRAVSIPQNEICIPVIADDLSQLVFTNAEICSGFIYCKSICIMWRIA